eukprot:gene23204-biopygen8492
MYPEHHALNSSKYVGSEASDPSAANITNISTAMVEHEEFQNIICRKGTVLRPNWARSGDAKNQDQGRYGWTGRVHTNTPNPSTQSTKCIDTGTMSLDSRDRKPTPRNTLTKFRSQKWSKCSTHIAHPRKIVYFMRVLLTRTSLEPKLLIPRASIPIRFWSGSALASNPVQSMMMST